MSGEVLDLRPRLVARKAKDCAHPCVLVDDEVAEMECSDCGAEIDPWWYLRRLAHEDGDRRSKTSEWISQQEAKYAVWQVDAMEKARKLTDEVNALNEAKYRLLNEQVNGVRVGAAVRRRRKSP